MKLSLFAKILLSLCLITPSLSFGQNQSRARIKSYYELINKAELAIIDSQYTVAAQSYQKAFQLKYPNDKDLLNAFLVSYAQRDSLNAGKYLNEMVYKGLNIALFESFNLPDTSFLSSISGQCDSLWEAEKTPGVFAQVSVLDSIFKEDQRVRQEDFTDTAEAIRIDNLNVARLGQYIDQYGFPSFERKGWWLRPGVAINDASYVFGIVLWHQRGALKTSIDEKMKLAVLDGAFRPDYWEALLMYRDDADKKYGTWLPKSDKDLTADQIKQININRASVYLESLQDYRRKFEAQRTWARQNRPYRFSFLNPFLVDMVSLAQMGLTVR